MLNNTPFINPFIGNNPYSTENIQRLQQYNQYNQYNINKQDKFDDIQKTISGLTNDERVALMSDEQFMSINQSYEQALLMYVVNQYRQQYNSTPEGSRCLEQLDNALNSSVKGVKDKIESERAQLKELSELLSENPNIINELKKAKNGGKD